MLGSANITAAKECSEHLIANEPSTAKHDVCSHSPPNIILITLPIHDGL